MSATVRGRKIIAVLDRSAFIQPENDCATVSFGSHKVVVEKDRAFLDGAELGRFPPESPEVEVDVQEDQLAVVVGGKSVATTKVD